MKTTHPFLAATFPNNVSSEVIFDGINKFAVYSDDSAHSLILGMGPTLGDALDNAENTVKKMIKNGNI